MNKKQGGYMRRRVTLLLITTYAYALCAHATNYSCDIFKGTEKIMTLPGSVADSSAVGREKIHPNIDPNIALSFTLCQQAGFKLIGVQLTIPGLRSPTNVTKIEQYPDPACVLKCTPMPP
jgi:hypothetical protein